jgi:hypothetical protein
VTRALRIDLRRSSAVGTGLLLLTLGLLGLFLMSDAEWYAGRWTKLAVTQRTLLDLLWPLTLAAGAWQVGRDRRGRVGELFSSTGRPAWQRVASPAVALIVTVTAAFLLLLAAGLPKVLPTATYVNPAALGIVAAGLIGLVAAALLGMGVGRLLPSPFTAPALAVAGFGVMIAPSLHAPIEKGTGRVFEFLSPTLSPTSSDFVVVPGRVNAIQIIWLLAFAVTGYLLLAATSRRQRIAAALPVVLGALIVIPMLPHGDYYEVSYVPDAGAQALACADGTPQVCVRQVHAALLPAVTQSARQALQRLSRLPEAPTSAVEMLDVGDPLAIAAPNPSTLTFTAWIDDDGRLGDPGDLDVDLHDIGAGTDCPEDYPRGRAARLAAGFVLSGQALTTGRGQELDALLADAYPAVSALPEDELSQRLVATRTALLACTGDPLAILTGGKR